MTAKERAIRFVTQHGLRIELVHALEVELIEFRDEIRRDVPTRVPVPRRYTDAVGGPVCRATTETGQ